MMSDIERAESCFNEAAAFRRGNHHTPSRHELRGLLASMRPRLFAAEIVLLAQSQTIVLGLLQ